MKRCTLDTNIITAFLKKELKVVKRVSDYLEFFDRFSINVISYYEILRGLKDLGDEEKQRDLRDSSRKMNWYPSSNLQSQTMREKGEKHGINLFYK